MPTAAVVVTDRCIDSLRAQREPPTWAAYLKARNPWLLLRRRGGPGSWLTFIPTYAALVVTSAALYALQGRLDVVRAMARGAAAGFGGATDPPPARA